MDTFHRAARRHHMRRVTMKYAVIFEQGPSSVGVTVPDLPGCFLLWLRESRQKFHIETLREDGEPVPEPTSHAEDVSVAA